MAKIFKKTQNYFIVEDSISGIKEIETPSKDAKLIANRTSESVRILYKDEEGNPKRHDYPFGGVKATGSMTITGGASGSIDTFTVGGVAIISGAVSFITTIDLTAAAVADNINAHTSVPNFTAIATTDTVDITAVLGGDAGNGAIVVTKTTLTTTEDAATLGGAAGLIDAASAEYADFEDAITGTTGIGSVTGA